jgi:type II secretory pathway predicted ATPase ExeA
MYESYWQLAAKPFEPTGEQPWYYPSEVHQGALSKLRYAIESRRAAALITGASGLGKSMIARTIARQLGPQFQPFAQVIVPPMTPREMLAYIANEMGAPMLEPASFSLEESIRRIQLLLAENTAAGRHAVLALDEAHRLTDAQSLETVRLLLNLCEQGVPGLTVLLVGQTSLLTALNRQSAIEERISVKVLLQPFSLDETISYINHRLAAAGARHEIFTADAIAQIYELTGGNPRRINRLCDLALLAGYAEQRSRLSADDVDAVSNELVTVSAE